MAPGIGISVSPVLGGGFSWARYWAARYASSLSLSVVSDTRIDLSWTNNGTADYDGISIKRSTDGDTFTEIDTVATGTTTYIDSGLIEKVYYYRVEYYKADNYSGYTQASTLIRYLVWKDDFPVFDGTNEVSMGDLGITEPVTVSMKITPTSITDDKRLLVQKDSATTAAGGFGIDANNVRIWDGSAFTTALKIPYDWNNEEHLITLVYRASGVVSAFWDGTRFRETASSFDFNGFTMGIAAKFTDSFGNRYTGEVSDLIIYTSELTDEEVASQYSYLFPAADEPAYNSSQLDVREPTTAELDALDTSMADIITGIGNDGFGRCFFIRTDAPEGKYFLYYAKTGTEIKLLVSDDAETWTLYSPDPIFTVSRDICVLKIGDVYHLYYYSASSLNMNHAISNNPLFPSISGTPILASSETGWDSAGITYPGVVYKGGTYYFYYMGYNGTNWAIGVATSDNPDGPYTKYAGNPVLDLGAAGEFDDVNVFDPHPVLIGDTLYMAYTGGEPLENLGIATSTDMFTFTKYANNPVIAKDAGGQEETINFNLNVAEGKLRCYATSRSPYKLIQSSVVMT